VSIDHAAVTCLATIVANTSVLSQSPHYHRRSKVDFMGLAVLARKERVGRVCSDQRGRGTKQAVARQGDVED